MDKKQLPLTWKSISVAVEIAILYAGHPTSRFNWFIIIVCNPRVKTIAMILGWYTSLKTRNQIIIKKYYKYDHTLINVYLLNSPWFVPYFLETLWRFSHGASPPIISMPGSDPPFGWPFASTAPQLEQRFPWFFGGFLSMYHLIYSLENNQNK
jgi:hypothetical protein